LQFICSRSGKSVRTPCWGTKMVVKNAAAELARLQPA